jgi:hypothetical protein
MNAALNQTALKTDKADGQRAGTVWAAASASAGGYTPMANAFAANIGLNKPERTDGTPQKKACLATKDDGRWGRNARLDGRM